MKRPKIELPNRIVWYQGNGFISGVEKIQGKKHDYRVYIYHNNSGQTEEWPINCDIVDAIGNYLTIITAQIKNLSPQTIKQIINSVIESLKPIKIPLQFSDGSYIETSLWNLCVVKQDPETQLPRLQKFFSNFGFFDFDWLEE